MDFLHRDDSEWSEVMSRYIVRILTASAVVLFLFLGTQLLQPREVLAFNCGNSQSSHCYGTEEWDQNAGYYSGGYTAIKVVHMGCSSPCSFVDNEMWLGEVGCSGSTDCWVEVGYWQAVNAGEDFFWAHNDSRGFILHDLGQIPSGAYNNNAYIQIWSTGTNLWGVNISAPGFSQLNTNISQTFSPDHVKVGQELAGQGSSASAQYADYTSNKYEHGSNWYYESTDGIQISYAPPYMVTIAAANGSNHGGDYQTHCC